MGGGPNGAGGGEGEAMVQRVGPATGGDEWAAGLRAYGGARLARYKCPRSVDFIDQLPRQDTGKLYKRLLRDRYWGDRDSRIV